MSRPINFETFFFGLATGIACVATFQYLVALTGISKHYHIHRHQNDIASAYDVKENAVEHSKGEHSKGRFSNSLTPEVLASLDEKLILTTSKLQKIVLHMVSEFKKGLASEKEALKMLPSFVTKRPTGILSLGTLSIRSRN